MKRQVSFEVRFGVFALLWLASGAVIFSTSISRMPPYQSSELEALLAFPLAPLVCAVCIAAFASNGQVALCLLLCVLMFALSGILLMRKSLPETLLASVLLGLFYLAGAVQFLTINFDARGG